MRNFYWLFIVFVMLCQLTACASDEKHTPPPPEKPVLLGATNDGTDDVIEQRLPKTSRTQISATEGTLLGAAAGTVGGALTGDPWLIPVGTAVGGLAGFGITVFSSDDYILQTGCMNSESCSPWGALQPQGKLAHILHNFGGTLIDTGSNKVMIIPSRFLFLPNTAEIQHGQVDLLSLIASVAAKSPGRYIVIMAHVADIGTANEQFDLTNAQAHVVAQYLKRYWTLRTRPIASVGLGSQFSIATDNTTQGRAKNNAIIISLGEGVQLDYYKRFILDPDQYGQVTNLGNKYRNGVLPWQSLYQAPNQK